MSKITCFGEILWDVFPTHKTIGGAPLNVALRLQSFQNEIALISCLGDDKLKGWSARIKASFSILINFFNN